MTREKRIVIEIPTKTSDTSTTKKKGTTTHLPLLVCAFWKSGEEERKKEKKERERRGDIVIPVTEHYDKAVKLPSKNFHFASLRRGERVLRFWVTPPSRCNPCSGGESLAV